MTFRKVVLCESAKLVSYGLKQFNANALNFEWGCHPLVRYNTRTNRTRINREMATKLQVGRLEQPIFGTQRLFSVSRQK